MKKGWHVVATGVKRSEPDFRKLARVLIQREIEKQAEEEAAKKDQDEDGEVAS